MVWPMGNFSLWGLPGLEVVFASSAVELSAAFLLWFIARRLDWTPRQMIAWVWERLWGRE